MAASDGIIVGRDNVVDGNVSDFALLNCQGMRITAQDSGKTFMNNGRGLFGLSTTASASSPVTVVGVYSNYYTDTTAGDVTFIFDVAKIKDLFIYIVVTNATNHIILSTDLNTELINTTAVLPLTVVPSLANWIVVTSDGTNLYYTLQSASVGSGAGAWGSITIGTGIVTQNDLISLISLRI